MEIVAYYICTRNYESRNDNKRKYIYIVELQIYVKYKIEKRKYAHPAAPKYLCKISAFLAALYCFTAMCL